MKIPAAAGKSSLLKLFPKCLLNTFSVPLCCLCSWLVALEHPMQADLTLT